MVKDSNSEMIKRIENFIQNLDDGLLILHPSGMKIKYHNEDKSKTRTLTDWILTSVEMYEEHRKSRYKPKFAKIALDWIRRGYANNVIRAGSNLLRRFEELNKEYQSVKDECENLRGMYLGIEKKFEKYKEQREREFRKKNR